jgi:hypothetical protein
MGRSHSVCQDYALAGTYYGQGYAILSDGCSGIADVDRPGSPYTDWGARLLAYAAWQRVGPLSEGHFHALSLVASAASSARCLELPRSALDATLLVAVETEGGDALVYQTADGVVAWRETTGAIRYETVRYAKGAPRYLSYLLDPRAMERLLERESDDDLLAGTMEVTSNRWTREEGWGPQLIRMASFDAETPWERRLRIPGPRSDLSGGSLHERADVVAVLSDGVESFVDRDNQPVGLETLLPELFAFKNLEGEFVTRRCKRFLEKICAERGWRHEDDFSMAALHLRDVMVPKDPKEASGGCP